MFSSSDSIHAKQSASLERGGAGDANEAKADPVRHVSSGVAHELNNLLTIIHGYTEQLLLNHGGDPALEKYLKYILEAARCAADVVRASRPLTATIPPPQEIGRPSGEQPVV